MITPRAIRLVRVSGWRAAQRAIAALACCDGPAHARQCAVLVPSHGAAWQLRRTLELLLLVDAWHPSPRDAELLGVTAGAAGTAVALPDLVTRDEWYRLARTTSGEGPPRLEDVEREVVLRAACDDVRATGIEPPFAIRPGLVAEILAFYDALRRQQRTLDDVERLCTDRLEAGAESDRGAARMLQQTRFLVGALRGYEARTRALAAVDEHGWRARLASGQARASHPQLVLTVADQLADGSGLWPGDFDVLTRVPGLDRIDVVVTERVLATGFHERLHERLPGIEECRPHDLEMPPLPEPEAWSPEPVLSIPPREGLAQRFHFLARDREDEVADAIVRLTEEWSPGGAASTAAAAVPDGAPGDAVPALQPPVALVFERPLPYLYVARQLLDSAGLAYEAADALPLAAEPAAAALDVVVEFVTSGYARQAALALLRSPHLRHEVDGTALAPGDVPGLEAAMREADFTAGRERLEQLAMRLSARAAEAPRQAGAARAARAAVRSAEALAPLERAAPATEHLDALLAFLAAHDTPTPPDAPWAERERRARAAVRSALGVLRDAHARHGDPVMPVSDTVASIRRRIESHTFAPRTGTGGIHLVDAPSARYGRFERVHLLGLVEGEWPATTRRNIFFPAWILRDLGWPPEETRQAAARAAFHDMLRLAERETSVSSFSLEDDALVRPSVLLEDLPNAGLVVERCVPPVHERLFAHELLARGVTPSRGGGALPAASWGTLRAERPDAALPRFHGQAGATSVAAHSVTAIETYLGCPFKYFASRVLGLEDERPDEPGLDPRRRGTFEHEVFERFFREWEGGGHGAITPALVPVARARFRALVEEMVGVLADADRAVERIRLIGSPAMTGIGERVFRLEARRPVPVVARRLEVDLAGTYDLPVGDRTVAVTLRGIADRVDLLGDGTLRVVDYKSGHAPEVRRALQLPVYGFCAEQRLAGEHGRAWRLGEAAYIAFGEKRPWVPVIASPDGRDAAVADALARLAAAVAGIARGDFPPNPVPRTLCATCAFAAVCRKDYVDAG